MLSKTALTVITLNENTKLRRPWLENVIFCGTQKITDTVDLEHVFSCFISFFVSLIFTRLSTAALRRSFSLIVIALII